MEGVDRRIVVAGNAWHLLVVRPGGAERAPGPTNWTCSGVARFNGSPCGARSSRKPPRRRQHWRPDPEVVDPAAAHRSVVGRPRCCCRRVEEEGAVVVVAVLRAGTRCAVVGEAGVRPGGQNLDVLAGRPRRSRVQPLRHRCSSLACANESRSTPPTPRRCTSARCERVEHRRVKCSETCGRNPDRPWSNTRRTLPELDVSRDARRRPSSSRKRKRAYAAAAYAAPIPSSVQSR